MKYLNIRKLILKQFNQLNLLSLMNLRKFRKLLENRQYAYYYIDGCLKAFKASVGKKNCWISLGIPS